MDGRLTPPSNQDGPYGWEPDSVGMFDSVEGATDGSKLSTDTAKKLALESYESSTNWINSGVRVRWSNSLRAFNSQHPQGSKYLSREYAYRSTLYRPKTRTMVRKDEAATAAAFFSNEDVVSIQPGDPDDPKQEASAAIIQALLQYRLTQSIPWFLTLVGARQDAEVMGICVARVEWDYEERVSHTEQRPVMDATGAPSIGPDGQPITESIDVMKKVRDQPVVDLVEPENIRFEPGADWRQPLEKSPYIIHLMPMYVQDVLAKMQPGPNGEPQEWKTVSKSALQSATDLDDDTTRRAREQNRVPGKDADVSKPSDYSICWVRRNILKWGGQDWQFYTIGTAGEMLTEPVPLSDVCLHGERPYVGGFVVLETHKTYPSSKVELVRDLQRASNDDWNLRFDNVKLSLNPRQFVRAGLGIELNDLQRFAPGKAVLVNSKPGTPMNGDIMWDRPPPPDASAYAEQDRINLDFDDLTGAFTNTSVQSSQAAQQSATGMNLMSGEASGMNEYELRVFAETLVEPVIRKLVKLEQAYETDPTILALAGKSAGLLQKFGISEITDELLNQEVTTRVNVGIGATNPRMRGMAFMAVGDALGKMFGPIAAQAADFQEVAKELFGLAGYKDGERFMKKGFDPQVAMLQQQLQQVTQKANAKSGSDPAKIEVDKQRLQLDAQSQQTDAQIEQAKLELQKSELALKEKQLDLEAYKTHHEIGRDAREQALVKGEADHESRSSELDAKQAAVDEARAHVESLQHMIAMMAQQHAASHHELAQGIAGLASHIRAPKRVVRGPDGKVAGVEVIG